MCESCGVADGHVAAVVAGVLMPVVNVRLCERQAVAVVAEAHVIRLCSAVEVVKPEEMIVDGPEDALL